MKVNGEMIKREEKEYIIIRMEIEEWVIILTTNQLESMFIYVKMVMFESHIFKLLQLYY